MMKRFLSNLIVSRNCALIELKRDSHPNFITNNVVRFQFQQEYQYDRSQTLELSRLSLEIINPWYVKLSIYNLTLYILYTTYLKVFQETFISILNNFDFLVFIAINLSL